MCDYVNVNLQQINLQYNTILDTDLVTIFVSVGLYDCTFLPSVWCSYDINNCL